MLSLEDKEKYVVHYSNLQFYLRQGMRLKKVHRVIEFDQEPWKCELIYTDTDSLILDIETEDVYKDMQEYSWLHDTSNYPKDHQDEHGVSQADKKRF